jgi:exosortase
VERKSRTVKKLRPIHFLLLFAGAAVVAWHPLVRTLRLALENDAYTHILLILPLSFTFIYVDWKSLTPSVNPTVRLGFLILCVAGVIAVLSRWQVARPAADLQLAINMLALVMWWIGGFVFCFGTKVSRATLFPLCFLFWMVPIPSFVLHGIIGWLQQGSALAARLLFSATGVPVAQDGLMLSIPGLTVEVATECSSIRSSLMLLVTTMVLAQLLLRSPWRKALVIALAVPLSVAKNGLRIFTIAMLGTRVDPGYLTGRLHHQGGIVFFAIALVGVFLLLWILRCAEGNADRKAVLHQ